MDVKPGYKQTEVGAVPINWEVKRLGDVAPLQRGFDLPTSRLEKGPYPVVYSNGILNYHARAMAKGPGVVTGRSGTIGRVNYVETDYWPHNTTLWVTDFKGNFPSFVFYLYSAIRLDRFSTGSGVPTLNRNDVHEFDIAVPPLSEQQAIAEALSDVDALISALDRLIAKKRAIKQGAMQELLTGRRRLPGFDGEWEMRRLGEIVEKLVNGGTPSTQQPEYWAGHIPWITGADILDQQVSEIRRYITEEAVRNSSTNVVERGNLLLVSRTGVGKLAIAPFAVAISQDFTGLYVRRDRMLPEFLFRFLDYKPEVLRSQNQGTSIQGITRETLISIPVPVPQLAEQTAIATILSDMDAEIAALEERRDKTRHLKQGMMQELLTGKTRLL